MDGSYRPTCTEKGSERRECANCDAYETREATATGHDYIDVVTKPTCTEQGYTTHTCRCGDSYIDSYTSATGHSWNNGVVTVEPTEETAGVRTYTCTTCGATREETIPTLDHVHRYTTVVTSPTCTEQGYTTHTCACGDSYIDSYTSATGHIYGAWTPTKVPTCTEKGNDRRDCANCDAYETREVAAIGHDYGTPTYSWNRDHTVCTAARVCENDGSHKETENGTVRKGTTNATCTANGKTVYTATFNNSAFVTQTYEEVITTSGHSYDISKWGYKEADGHAHLCSACNEHDTVIRHTSSGTATEDTAEICTACGYVITPELGHTHNASDEWEYNGTHHWHDCVANDGQEYNREAHSFGDWAKADDITHKRTCACGKVETANHDWNDGEITTQPTHTEYGEMTYTCDDCGATKTEKIEKTTAHSFGEWTVINQATETGTGSKTRTCACGYTVTEEIPALGSETEILDDPNNPDAPNTSDVTEEPKDGLGASAIASIVAGSVAVVGVCGFALVWFAIKKKT